MGERIQRIPLKTIRAFLMGLRFRDGVIYYDGFPTQYAKAIVQKAVMIVDAFTVMAPRLKGGRYNDEI